MFKKRIVGILFSVALVMGLMPMVASAADPISTDVVIHKLQVPQGTALTVHDGEEKDQSELPGTPLAGIVFKYWTIDTTKITPAQMAQLKGLSTIEQVEQFVVDNSGVLINPQTTAATAADGTVTLSGLAEGQYFVAETNGAANNVTDYIGVPFVLELPAMKVDGTGYFGTGANALHVYPKNALNVPGLDLETQDISTSNRIGSSSFNVLKKDTNNSYVLLETKDLPTGFSTLEELPSGDYRLVNTAAPTGYLVDNRPIDFSVASGSVTFSTDNATVSPRSSFVAATSTANAKIILKLSPAPVPEKDVNGESSASFNVGDTFTWNVKLPVPSDISGYTTFDMVDMLDTKLSWGGTDTQGDVKVQVDGADVPAAAYTKTVSGQILTINFTPAALASYAGKTIVVSYTTYINSTADMGTDIKNNVELTFNNGHGGTGTTEPEDPPSVWTGGAKFKKVDGTDNTKALAGAEFKIATNAEGTTFVVWTAELIAANTASTFVSKTLGQDITMKSGADGKFEIKGLKEGTYYLVETKAPQLNANQTYNLLRDPSAFTITKTSYADTSELSIENNAGLEIPQTGGIGTIIFTVAGLALMGFAIVLFKKKRNSRNDASQ